MSSIEQTPRDLSDKKITLDERVLRTMSGDIPQSEIYREERRSAAAEGRPWSLAAVARNLMESGAIGEAVGSLIVAGAQLSDHALAEKKLNHIQSNAEGRLSPDERLEARRLKAEVIVPFNHSIKSIVDTNPDASIGDVASLLVKINNSYQSSLPSGGTKVTSAEAKEVALQSLDGMRHELAVESMLTAIDVNYDYQTTVEDDMRGTDIRVEIDGQFYSLDIKASVFGEENANRKALRAGRSPKAVWSCLTEHDFTGKKGSINNALSISYDVAQIKSEEFYNRMWAIVYDGRVQDTASSAAEAAQRVVSNDVKV